MKLIPPKRLADGDKVASISTLWSAAGDVSYRYLKGKERLNQVFNLEVTET
ncbi:MccC family protein [Chryseobacterium sp. StRB126]|uniref:hypothetical protein n=1 Tax=Chryseobacterium sp. StRB126 TaxID=878220 RepID=UPI0004E9899D|nr:hypothetical protein [Chryseobacterium sp. StRB126]BAP31126.1 MccC family protein [Chryseobacterium sp. StRB126]